MSKSHIDAMVLLAHMNRNSMSKSQVDANVPDVVLHEIIYQNPMS
ncbi:hypothetical protein F383_19033 [Gossypium arboreum]|uniref:Uncharacterized protein n=1 Tax=Gossypium arboreum TaxID=29729 RepID=A0A0B0NQX3_GOSAR|nr:hypothetical protein F383_19033 [Gossypium arboreum]